MKRIELLDVWRSLAILMMVAYHLIYDLYLFGVISYEQVNHPLAFSLRLGAVVSFMLISGMVVRYSKNSLRRGAIVFCCGLLVSLVMGLMGMPVRFGVLHNLGVMMMLHSLFSRIGGKLPKGAWFVVACALVFAATYYIGQNVFVETKLLVPFGLVYEEFYSADYYPLLPWGMLFVIGVWLGEKLEVTRERFPLLQRKIRPMFTFMGRNSLVIYLAHQPLLYAICWIIWDGSL
ncbi:MAG: DUF1624 domain-containing protein [Oscillospiraceae bacterium]|nr:DUF1624 domain-containing protein [Oscillospiraceae bacterium]